MKRKLAREVTMHHLAVHLQVKLKLLFNSKKVLLLATDLTVTSIDINILIATKMIAYRALEQ